MNGQYEVLNPWAEADPIPLRGISPRVPDLNGKTVGFYCHSCKRASLPILTTVEKKLRERFPTLKSSWFEHRYNSEITEAEEKAKFEKWVKGVDLAIAAVGD